MSDDRVRELEARNRAFFDEIHKLRQQLAASEEARQRAEAERDRLQVALTTARTALQSEAGRQCIWCSGERMDMYMPEVCRENLYWYHRSATNDIPLTTLCLAQTVREAIAAIDAAKEPGE